MTLYRGERRILPEESRTAEDQKSNSDSGADQLVASRCCFAYCWLTWLGLLLEAVYSIRRWNPV